MPQILIILLCILPLVGWTQCNGGSNQGTLSPAPSTSVNTISIKGGRYYTFTATAGQIFLFSTHEDDGGSTAFDTKITILDNNDNPIAFDDDYCDRASRVVWTATNSGTFRILMMRYNCVGTGTPSVMAYQILSSYVAPDYTCAENPCTNDEYDLLLNMPSDLFDYVCSGGEPDANGMIGTNQSGWQGAEFQRGGVRRILGAVINNDNDLMEDAWLTIRATFDQQQTDGGFGDDASDVAFWLHECSHSLLILKDSPLYATYQDSFTKYLPLIQDALEYITTANNLDLLFNIYDKQAANRLFIDANAIGLTGLLIGDTATYSPIARTFIAQGLEIFRDSTFCEKGGYDTSYQGTSLFELNYYLMRFDYNNLDCILRASTIWEANRVASNGFIDTVGNTRTGSCQEVYNGNCKEVNYREVARGLYYYGYRFCDFTNGIDPAIRVYRYDQNNQSYNPTVNCNGACSTPLPVELSDFTYECSENKLFLTWKTLSEVDNIGFEIQHRKDDQWQSIDFINSQGNGNETQFYEFEINDFYEKNYYRLKQWDENEKFEYSPILEINCKKTASPVMIYPNPATNKIHLTFEQLNNKLEVFDLYGKQVYQKTFYQEKNIELNIANWQSGVYFFKIGNQVQRLIIH